MTGPSPAPASPREEQGGLALLRDDAGSEDYRERAELPSRLGRFVLVGLGGVIVGAGTGVWFAHPSPVADGLLAFGAVLIVLGFIQHRLLLRDRDHWPHQALLWSEGLELVLANGEIRAAPWSDAKFTLDLYARPMSDGSPDELLLAWKMDPKIPMVLLTPEGFDQIREAAILHGLELSEYRADNRRRTLRGFEIRTRPLAAKTPEPPIDSPQTVT